jgi:hypothetical protein
MNDHLNFYLVDCNLPLLLFESGVKHHNSNSLNPENFVRNNERWRRRVVKKIPPDTTIRFFT